MTATFAPSATRPLWLLLPAAGGVAWNLYGLVQFAASLSATPESLVAGGLTPEQAAVMTGYPLWMTLSFGAGVGGGLLGAVLLLLRRRPALPVLALSLAAYVALYLGDIVHGVFAAMGAPQVIVLTLVVAIAAGLLALARTAAARHLLS